MGIGLTREKVGDILVLEDRAQIVCLKDAAPIILSQFDQAGRYRLKLREISLCDLSPAPVQVKLVKDTVATLRLDAVLSSGFSVARGKAADLIAAGRVSVNHRECTKADKLVAQGDVLTCRGRGKCILKTVGGSSRKGRIIIEMERYV
jgi:RNA-binding protein YlmH